MEAEDVGMAVVKFKNGAIGTIEGTTNVYPKNLEETLYIFGEKGTVKIGGTSTNNIDVWDFADETEEDISGVSVAGDESVDYRMLMRDTKNTGKHDEDESVYTKTVRTATGKVITVELDGLPGENKRPKDLRKLRKD